MGKRKSRKKPMSTKVKRELPKSFDCPFCQHERTVTCKMDRERAIAAVSCRVCGASYQMMINVLSEPVDVYHEWIDQCQAEKEREELGIVDSDDEVGETRLRVDYEEAEEEYDDDLEENPFS